MTRHMILKAALVPCLLSGCFLRVKKSSSGIEISATEKTPPHDLMLTALATSDQQKMFGPFPRWKTRFGSYQYESFAMSYLLNAKTRMRDIHRSWIAALYRDTRVSNRYMLKFVVRNRGAECDMWKTEDNGAVSFALKDGGVYSVKRIEGANQKSTIDVGVYEDARLHRYLQFRISGQGWYDELRSSIAE